MSETFPKGTRVQAIGRAPMLWMGRRNPDIWHRHGTVIGRCRDGVAVRVLWDGLKAPQDWHLDFLARVDAR